METIPQIVIVLSKFLGIAGTTIFGILTLGEKVRNKNGLTRQGRVARIGLLVSASLSIVTLIGELQLGKAAARQALRERDITIARADSLTKRLQELDSVGRETLTKQSEVLGSQLELRRAAAALRFPITSPSLTIEFRHPLDSVMRGDLRPWLQAVRDSARSMVDSWNEAIQAGREPSKITGRDYKLDSLSLIVRGSDTALFSHESGILAKVSRLNPTSLRVGSPTSVSFDYPTIEMLEDELGDDWPLRAAGLVISIVRDPSRFPGSRVVIGSDLTLLGWLCSRDWDPPDDEECTQNNGREVPPGMSRVQFEVDEKASELAVTISTDRSVVEVGTGRVTSLLDFPGATLGVDINYRADHLGVWPVSIQELQIALSDGTGRRITIPRWRFHLAGGNPFYPEVRIRARDFELFPGEFRDLLARFPQQARVP